MKSQRQRTTSVANDASSWHLRDGSPAESSGPTTPGVLLTSTVRRDDDRETTKAVAMMMAAPHAAEARDDVQPRRTSEGLPRRQV